MLKMSQMGTDARYFEYVEHILPHTYQIVVSLFKKYGSSIKTMKTVKNTKDLSF